MFGVRPTLEVKGQRKYRSCWGAFISFLLILFILFYTFFQVLEILKFTDLGQTFISEMQDVIPDLFYISFNVENEEDKKDALDKMLIINKAANIKSSLLFIIYDSCAHICGFIYLF